MPTWCSSRMKPIWTRNKAVQDHCLRSCSKCNRKSMTKSSANDIPVLKEDIGEGVLQKGIIVERGEDTGENEGCKRPGNPLCNPKTWLSYQNGCCSVEEQCGENEGDCNLDSECFGGLVLKLFWSSCVGLAVVGPALSEAIFEPARGSITHVT